MYKVNNGSGGRFHDLGNLIIKSAYKINSLQVFCSVPDPNAQDPYVFRPPGYESGP